MKQVTIDFTYCKNMVDLHQELKQKLDFPDFYGQNLDALWDCLTGFIDLPVRVRFKGLKALSKELQHEALRMYEVFVDAENQYGHVHPSICD